MARSHVKSETNMLQNLAADLAQNTQGIQAALSYHALPILALGSALALLSELLARVHPLKDEREERLADLLGVETENVVSIGDGIQLWRDAERHLDEAIRGENIPYGSPSLEGSYVVLHDNALLLVAMHNTARLKVLPDPEDNSLADSVQGIFDHARGETTLGLVPYEVDMDCEHRAYLVEAIAHMRFGYTGRVAPVILLHDENGLAPLPDADRAIPGLKACRLTFDPHSPFNDIPLPQAAGHFSTPSEFRQLASWLRSQPARATPATKIKRRSQASLN
jgi:hypothetical protein